MTEFVTMWKNYVNFTDRTTRRGYWMAYLFVVIATVICMIIDTIIGFGVITGLFSLAVLLPSLGMMVRRLRDAGKHWANVFWIFLPFVGVIILIVLLCKPSIPDNGIRVV